MRPLYTLLCVQIELLNCGVNFVRINLSHATREWAKDTVDALREYLHSNPGKVCALVVELAGPEARVGCEIISMPNNKSCFDVC